LALSVRPQGYEAVLSEGEQVLRAIEAAGGRLEVSDRSHPEEIQRMFGLSKGAFKKLIGSLYRQGKIVIRHDSIELPK
jgi:predicted RNA-binding protein (virulence factor B family)